MYCLNVQPLEIPARDQLSMGDDLDLAIALLRDRYLVSQISYSAIDLDPFVEELLKGRDIEDLVVRRLRRIDNVLISSQCRSGCAATVISSAVPSL